jgi:UDP-N-acetylmuramate dehydrogenase
MINSILATRRLKHPKIPLNFGSTFKRPFGGKHPGWYLEQVGMKGIRSGGAMVAEEHANWILNMGNATSQDVKVLISEGQKRVSEEFGINLEREVIYLPEDMADWI